MDEMRICRTCGLEKPMTEYYPHPTSQGGRLLHCRTCATAKRRESHARVGRKTNTPYKRKHRLKSKYGITEEQYAEMYAQQHGRCAICYEEEKVMAVDHNHMCCPGKSSCGKCVRGLLCNRCNVGIGMLADSQAYLFAAVTYLERYDS